MKITVLSVPTTSEEFSALPQNDLSKPENTCAMFLLALALYLKDSDAGVAALNTLRGPRPLGNYDIQFLRDRLRGKSYLPLAYFDGATPANQLCSEYSSYPRSYCGQQTAGYRGRISPVVFKNGRCRLSATDKASAKR